MRRPAWHRFLHGPGHRLVGVFLIFILLPGIVLGIFALRTLRRERKHTEQQIQERLGRITVQVSRDLDLQFRQWKQALESAPAEEMADLRYWPEMVRQAVKAPGSGAILWQEQKQLRASPSNQLLYVLSTASALDIRQESLPASFVQAESIELSQKDYPRAIRIYQRLAKSTDSRLRAFALHRLARTYRKAGLPADSVRTCQELERLRPTLTGQLPSDLIARSELCVLADERGDSSAVAKEALALYRDLVEGRWRLEKPRYSYYSEQCRTWIKSTGTAGEEFKQIETVEERKRTLTAAVEELLAQPKRLIPSDKAVHFAFWQAHPFRAIVVSGSFLSSYIWPRASSAAAEQGVDATLYTLDGRVVFGSSPEKMPSMNLARTIQVEGLPWRLVVWPRDPAAFYSDLQYRQDLYMGTLLFVVALLIFGSYVTARTVKREIEVARMRADFVSTVSHEFRSPLTGIRQLGEMLLRGRVAGEERQRRYYQ